MSRQNILWALVAIVVVIVVVILAVRYQANDRSAASQPSPHAIDQSK
jgi:hypothetical protein